MQTNMWPNSAEEFIRGTIMYYFSEEHLARKTRYENQEVFTLAAYVLIIFGSLLLGRLVSEPFASWLTTISYIASFAVGGTGIFLVFMIWFSVFAYGRIFSAKDKLRKLYDEPKKMYSAAVFLYTPNYSPVYANGAFWCMTIMLIASAVYHQSILIGVLTGVSRVLVPWTDRIRKRAFVRIATIWDK